MKYASLSLHELHRADLKEFNVKSKKERIRRYRRYVYEAVSLNQPEKGRVKVIKEKVLGKERSKEFVASHYRRFKDLFMSKNEKVPRPVAGIDGLYSLKRLSELI